VWLIGVDAGGSKTEAWAVQCQTADRGGGHWAVIGEGVGRAGPGNVRTLGVAAAAVSIRAAVERAVAAALADVAGLRPAARESVDDWFENSGDCLFSDEIWEQVPLVLAVAAVHVGAAGAADAVWARAVRAELLSAGYVGPVTVGGDVELVIEAARLGACDVSGRQAWLDVPTLEDVRSPFRARLGASDEGQWVAVIAGTGSVVCGQQRRIGGWGPLVGDAGSGFSIGRRALAAACAAEDGSGPCTVLRECLLADAGVASLREWLGRLPTWPAVIALLADVARHVVTSAATDGVAAEILATEMGLLAGQIVAARRDGFDSTMPVQLALAGGLLTGHAAAVTELLACVDDRLEQVGLPPFVGRVRVCRPVFGALQLACAAAITG